MRRQNLSLKTGTAQEDHKRIARDPAGGSVVELVDNIFEKEFGQRYHQQGKEEKERSTSVKAVFQIGGRACQPKQNEGQNITRELQVER